MKGFTSIIFLFAIAILVATAGYLVFAEKAATPILTEGVPTSAIATTTSNTNAITTPAPVGVLLTFCPDQWINNRMPMVIEPGQPRPTTQYFIYQGERRELVEFDMDWVLSNCDIEPSVVY